MLACFSGGFVSEEPSRRGWQGHVEQRSRAAYPAGARGDERRPDPGACEVGKTGRSEVAESEQHKSSGLAPALPVFAVDNFGFRRMHLQYGIPRHRQPKGPATDSLHLNHRVTPRLHTDEAGICG